MTLKADHLKNPLDPKTEDDGILIEDTVDAVSLQQTTHIARLPPIKYCTNPEYYLTEAAKEWLPKNIGEDPDSFATRAEQALSSFEPFYTYLKGLIIGTALRKGPKIPEGIDPKWEKFFDNVDLQGTKLKSFLKKVFSQSIDGGCVAVLTEYPVAKEVDNLAEERRLGLRPYWVTIKSEEILEVIPEIMTVDKNGEKEVKIVPAYFRFKTFYREGRPGRNQVVYPAIMEYTSRVPNPARNKDEEVEWIRYIKQDGRYVEHARGFLKRSTIPVKIVYGGEVEEFGIARPLLLDTARLNLRHWATSADLDVQIHENASSIPYATGVGTDEKITKSSSKLLTLENPQAKLGYMNAGMDGAETCLKRLEKLEKSMERLATVAMTTSKNQAESGFSKLLDRAQSDSQLAVLVTSMEDAINEAIEDAADYYGMPAVKVELNKDFVPVKLHSQQIQSYNQCFQADTWDLRTQLQILEIGDVFEGIPDFSIDKLLARMSLKGTERFSELAPAQREGLPPALRNTLAVGVTPGSPSEAAEEIPESVSVAAG